MKFHYGAKWKFGILLKNANPYGICTECYATFFLYEYSLCFDRLEFRPKFVRQVNWQSTEFLGSSPPIQFLFPHF